MQDDAAHVRRDGISGQDVIHTDTDMDSTESIAQAGGSVARNSNQVVVDRVRVTATVGNPDPVAAVC